MTLYPQKALLQLSWGVFLWPVETPYSIIAHSPEIQFWTPQNIIRRQIVTTDLVLFLDWMIHGSGNNSFIHIASHGRCGIFVNLMIPSLLRKMTITSTFHLRFQHIRQIACLFISFVSLYNIIMFKTKWYRQIKSYVYLKKNIVRDIISKTLLKTNLCEKYKSSGMLQTSCMKTFENTSILWTVAAWMNMIAWKMYFKHQSQITKIEQFQNYSSH